MEFYRERKHWRKNRFNLRAVLKLKLLILLIYSRSHKTKQKETNELFKQEKGKREVEN